MFFARGGAVRGKARQYHRSNRNPENSQGQFGEPVRIVQPGDAAGGQEGRQHCIKQQVDLTDRHTEQGGNHQRQDTFHACIAAVPLGPGYQIQAIQRGQLKQQLDNPGQKDTPRQCKYRLFEPGRGHQRGKNQRDIEKYRRQGRYREAAVAVQDSAAEAGHGNQHEIGKGNADQVCGELEFGRLVYEPGGENCRHKWRRHYSHQGDH